VEHGLTWLLQNVFRKKDFWKGQLDSISRAIALRPVAGLHCAIRQLLAK
jgi:hypothetical protein